MKGITERGNECGRGLHKGSSSVQVKNIDINGIVNIRGIEQKIYLVAAAAQFPHHACMNSSYSFSAFQISYYNTTRQRYSVSCSNYVCSCH